MQTSLYGTKERSLTKYQSNTVSSVELLKATYRTVQVQIQIKLDFKKVEGHICCWLHIFTIGHAFHQSLFKPEYYRVEYEINHLDICGNVNASKLLGLAG